ncbi:HdeD family acid-resistance protein [Halobaculum lipolyticum]|uniref:HdeD family acid-resistance protein n=1 Tax=Halobaculum lipolyticum TaxID=3032001 RepID=A0ABD5W8Z1_9EURY|nr:DUF308 domain-containing protein [Halobaculum sp. DT31]
MTHGRVPDGGSPPTNSERGDRSNAFRVAGVLIAVLGVFGILFPFVAGVSVSLLLGVALVVGAVVHAGHALGSRDWKGVLGLALLAVVYAVTGVALIANPLLGLASLTVVVIAYLLVSGVAETLIGLRIRGDTNWGWIVFSGALSVVLGLLLLAGFPGTAVWAVGLLFGVNLVSTGIAMVLVGRGVRSETPAGEDLDAGTAG